MAEDQPSLHVDTDWKRQAQEEKRRLAEQEKQRAAGPAAPTPPPGAAPMPGVPTGRGGRELPPASFATLVQSIVTQILFYLGDLAPQGSAPAINLDMAKHQIETLTMLEQKTANNLTEEERRLLDAALYETRMRYVQVASQYVT